MVVLGPPQIDIARANPHPVQPTQGVLRTCIVCILTEAIAFGVLLASLLHQMETLQSSISLQEVLDLVLGVLLRQSSNEQLSRPIVDLSGYDAQCNSIDDRHWPSWFDLWVLVKLWWSSNPQVNIMEADSVQLDGG